MPEYTHKMLLALSVGIVGITFAMDAASANPANCAKRPVMVEKLNERFGESPQSTGLTPGGQIIEVFAHPGTGTWTILLTLPDGTSCMMASGQAYERLNKPAGHAT